MTILRPIQENELEDKVTSIDISNKNEYILYLETEKKKNSFSTRQKR